MNIVVRLKKSGNRNRKFSLYDDKENLLVSDISKKDLISGISLSVDDSVKVITIKSNCCTKTWNVSISSTDRFQLAQLEYSKINTVSIWKHLTDPTIYNSFYGCTAPYIIEYPFGYEFYDQILQNVKDYTKVYKYLPNENGVFNDNRKIQTDDFYFNKAVLYNDQQSSGILNLVKKPTRNLSVYGSYPKFKTDSKDILFTKSDNFYQYNTFWDVVKDKQTLLFTQSCETMSIDKEVYQNNMDYSKRSFNKSPLRAKDLKVRHILDNSNDIHLVSQFLIAPAQISYK